MRYITTNDTLSVFVDILCSLYICVTQYNQRVSARFMGGC